MTQAQKRWVGVLWCTVAALTGFGAPVAAQNKPLFTTGTLTPGHAMVLEQTGTPSGSVASDGGPALAGNFTELGLTNDGLPFCVRDRAKQHLLCLGANALGGGTIAFNPIGGAPATGLQFNINGTTYPFPGSGTGTGNVTGPGSSPVGQLAFFNNTGGSLLTAVSNGPAAIGSDQFANLFGTPSLLVASAAGINTFVTQTVNNLPINTPAFPAGIMGAGKVTTNGNQVFGVTGWGECRQTGGATCIGAEFTVSNFTANTPDINLPPQASIGTTFTDVIGENVTCGSNNGQTNGCSIGLQITNDTADFTKPAFNTDVYLSNYRQYGLFIEAMPSGSQIGAAIKSNPTSIPFEIEVVGTPVPTGSVMTYADSVSGTNHFILQQNGTVAANSLEWVGHSAVPTLSACGTGAVLQPFSSDAKGVVQVGTGATGCVVTFGRAFTNPPVIVVGGENVAGILLSARSASSFSVGGSGIAGASVDYIVMSNGS